VIAVIDNGGANIASLLAALRRLGAQASVTRDADEIRRASHVILPGVGAAASGMARLKAAGLDRLIPCLTQPVLGICLGMQLLFEASEEGSTRCLGLLPGAVTRLKPAPGVSVPHSGWNRVSWHASHALTAGLDGDRSWFYFMHSYAVLGSGDAVGTASAGADFAAVVARDKVTGVQFHPERSGAAGARLLKNFLEFR
jgi:glutamine amidotransferase